MNDVQLKPLYTLEDHLEEKCKLDETYIDLYSTWKLNKKTLKQILKTIIINYPHFTEHDENHSNTIINNIEMLLGEERIKTLSATDTWMLLQCSYLHDFGMAILYKRVEQVWKSEEFKEYIEEKKSYDTDIKEAAEYIDSIGVKLHNKEAEIIWPLKVRKYVTRIIADYFRSKHAELTKEYLNTLLNEWNIDLSHNNLIKNRLLKSIAQISFIHTQDFDEVMKLDFKSNGFRLDYFHPRFIAEMIRLGDLLDLDNGRYNNYVKNVVGDIPKFSETHIEKHNSVSQLLITPHLVEVKADCKNENVYKETRNWFNWLEDEIKNLTLNWIDIIPETLTGYAPKFKKSIYYKGDEDFNNLVDLRFQISQEKAFDVIEGSEIYNDGFVFIREFIQNALDATKIQLWRDIKNGIYDSWIEKDIDKSNLTPFDIKPEIYKNYEIKIEVIKKIEKCCEVIIKDRGTGISIDALKLMSKVGESYQERKNLRKEINEMPEWLKPTGGFGIGLQSAFLINKQFKAYSKSDLMDKTLEVLFESRKNDGYIHVRNSDSIMKRGTEFHIIVDKDNFSYKIGGHVFQYINSDYDPIDSDDLLSYRIIDSVIEYCNSIFIPVSLSCEGHQINLSNEKDYISKPVEFDNKDERYYYTINENLTDIKIWDKKMCAYICCKINYKNIRSDIMVNYKGISIDRSNRIPNRYAWIYSSIDLLGFDTKEMLKLNRNELTVKAQKVVNKINEDAICFYMQKINEKIRNEEVSNTSFAIAYFLLAPKFKIDIDRSKIKNFISVDKLKIHVIEKQEDNSFKEDYKFIYDFIEQYPNLSYINVDDFKEYGEIGRITYNTKNLLEFMNKHKEEFDDVTIIDSDFIENILKYFNIYSIRYFQINKNEKLIVYKINNSSINISIETDKYTKHEFIKMLVSKKEETHKLIKMNAFERERSCIPIIQGYEDLAVKYVPFGICIPQDNVNWMISPILRKDNEIINQFDTCDDFVQSITNRDDYKKLLDFVCKNKLKENEISKERINELYIKLIKEYYNIVSKNK